MAKSSRQVIYVASMVPTAITMMVFCLFVANGVTYARKSTTYMVGDDDGWDLLYPMDTWTWGKTFYAGDILEFKYDYQYYNMVVVNRTGYETCIPNEGSVEYESGDDKIQLPHGYSYYIGTYNPADCAAGQKMAVKALAPK